MPAALQDGSFETGIGWTVGPNAGIVGADTDPDGDHFAAPDGAHFAYTAVANGPPDCPLFTQGRLTQTITVLPEQQGHYSLSFMMGWASPLIVGFIFDALLDGVSIHDTVGIGVGGAPIGRWLPGGTGAFFLAAGAHVIAITGRTINEFDPDEGGVPCRQMRVYWDALVLTALDVHPWVRLTVAPGGEVRQMIRPGTTERLTIHG